MRLSVVVISVLAFIWGMPFAAGTTLATETTSGITAAGDVSPHVMASAKANEVLADTLEAVAGTGEGPALRVARAVLAHRDHRSVARQLDWAVAARDSFADSPPEVETALASLRAGFDRYAAASKGSDFDRSEEFIEARQTLLEVVRVLHAAVLASRSHGQDPPAALDVPGLVHIDLGVSDDVYERDYALIVDGGGNDRYLNNAGGTGGCDPDILNDPPHSAALVDLGGDDRYGDPATAEDCSATNGGAIAGAGFLYDGDGTDVYIGGDAANGAGGLGGAGFLYDAGVANDEYHASGNAGNAGGFLGSGVLIDEGGSDLYDGHDYANGAGGATAPFIGGFGFLVDWGGGDDRYEGHEYVNAGTFYAESTGFLFDGGGDDEYVGEEEGVNGGGKGGEGILIDASGDDRYLAEGHRGINGGGMWGNTFVLNPFGGEGPPGAGFLYDGGGDDLYSAGDFAVNGGAAFGGSGFLYDNGGDDAYLAGSHGANGGGSAGAGFLYDANGSDRYDAGSRGANGGGYLGVGRLVDRAGDDVYVAVDDGANGQGGGTVDVWIPPTAPEPTPVPVPGAGLLLDEGGRDEYEDLAGGTGIDRTVVPKGTVGAQIDRQSP